MSYETVKIEYDGPVVQITLNRPESMNAISHQLEEELASALSEAEDAEGARVVVLTGAGRAFCAGYDLGGGGAGNQEYSADTIRWWNNNSFQEADKLRQIFNLKLPVIAAINGFCMGGGLWYSLACDISIAAESAIFAQPEVRGTSSTTYLFAALAGWKAANRYGLTGDHFDAAEALRLGIVNQVVPDAELMETVNALAHRIALVPEPSVRINKMVNVLAARAAGLETGLMMNALLNVLVHSSENEFSAELQKIAREQGLKAMLNKRDTPFIPEPFGPRSKQS